MLYLSAIWSRWSSVGLNKIPHQWLNSDSQLCRRTDFFVARQLLGPQELLSSTSDTTSAEVIDEGFHAETVVHALVASYPDCGHGAS